MGSARALVWTIATAAALTGLLLLVRAPVAGSEAGSPAAPGGSPVGAAVPPGELEERLRDRIEAAGLPADLRVGDARIHSSGALPFFYERRGYRPAWTREAGVTRRVDELLAALRGAGSHGLRPEDYHLIALEERVASVREASGRGGGPDVRILVDLEILLTDAFLLYGAHLLGGRVDPETLHADWVPGRREADLAGILDAALGRPGVGEALSSLQPPQPGYARLRTALSRYREIEAAGGWPAVPPGPTLRRGDAGERVGAVRERLAATGDVGPLRKPRPPGAEAAPADSFDRTLEEAVSSFQRRHGLEPDGVAGPATLEALNVPARRRIRTLEVNLERWRWLPQELGDPHVLVNAANFELDVVQAGDTVLTMRAVVGRPYRRTPVMSDRITYLVFNPYWHVPHNLAVQDQLPLIRQDAGYLSRVGMRVFEGWGADAREVDPAAVDWSRLGAANFPYRLRQDPGPANALGRVKFMFPNRFSVYLHDTPARELFARETRDFSSGCIRVERARDLAVFLLRGSSRWTPERIASTMQGGAEETVTLPRPVPVHLLYWTAWVEPTGQVHFRRDVYDRDDAVAVALREAPPGRRRDR